MTRLPNLGIAGLGVFLPETVRTNDAWPAEVVARWRAERTWSPEREQRALDEAPTEGARRVMAAMAQAAGDPFQGSRERRWMPPGMTAVDMEVEACRRAIADAGIGAEDVDFMLGSALIPDLLNAPDVCAAHARLGLRPDCFTLSADAVCNSFQMQLAVAEAFVRAGRYRTGIVVQSSAASRTTPIEQPYSVHFGDGATAVVVRAAQAERGLLAQAHRTDGTINRAKVCTVIGKDWWEEGRIWATPLDREAARTMFLTFADVGRDLIHEALRGAGAGAADVRFFACHQATSWWRSVVQEHAGLEGARSIDTYPWAGTISAGNLPLILHTARESGLLAPNDLVVLYQGGTGATYSASVMRW